MICCERNVVLADKLEDAKTKAMTDESRHRPWPRQVPTLRSKFIGLACTTTDQWPTYLLCRKATKLSVDNDLF
jgi:hypothetical protein